MKSNDAYIKAVFTVIAVCLVWICVRDFAMPVSAQRGTLQRVIIAGVEEQNALPVSIEKIELPDPSSAYVGATTKSLPIIITKLSLNGPKMIDGKLQEEALPISIKDIDLKSTLVGQEKTMPITIKDIDFGPLTPRPQYRYSLPVHGQVTIDNTKR